jgi:hypothetical protein
MKNFKKMLAYFSVASIAFAASAIAGEGEMPKVRIGTYDSRAIAVAYAASQFNPVKAKIEEYERAKAAGDDAIVKELEAWGADHQRQLHFQGFGRVPVDDLLKHVQQGISGLAESERLAAITMQCDYTSDVVEIVDVTDALVKLYNPSERTLEHIRNLRKVAPLPLIQLGNLPADQ